MRPGKRSIILIGGFVLAALLASRFSSASDMKTIGTARLHSLVMDNAYRMEGGRPQPFTIIDARPKEEYDAVHVFSAVSIPEKDFEKSKDLLPKDRHGLLVIYDNGPKNSISVKWAEKAAAAGYTNVEVYSEGFSAWKKKRMPVAPL